jgi:hypothetical protein
MPDQSPRSRAAALGYCNTLCRCARAALLASKFSSVASWNTLTDGSFYTWCQEQDSFSTSHHTADAWNHSSFDRAITQCGSQAQQVLSTATRGMNILGKTCFSQHLCLQDDGCHRKVTDTTSTCIALTGVPVVIRYYFGRHWLCKTLRILH